MGNPWVRFARWLGFDRNPLRRPADRIEAVLRLVVLILVVAGVPVATVAAGRTVDHLGLQQTQAQRAADHQVRAVLTEKAVADTKAHPYSNVPVVWVRAYWTASDGSVHRGQVLAWTGARAGSTVPVWISRSGAITDPPKSQAEIRIDVFITVMFTAELLPLLLISLYFLGRHLLDVRRLRAWDAEWGITGPQWRRNRAQ